MFGAFDDERKISNKFDLEVVFLLLLKRRSLEFSRLKISSIQSATVHESYLIYLTITCTNAVLVRYWYFSGFFPIFVACVSCQ